MNRKSLTLFSLIILVFITACTNGRGLDPLNSGISKFSFAKKYNERKLLDTLTYQTFNYFWEGAEPTSGMARERIHIDSIYPLNDRDVVTTGGSGFGLMAILVGVERGFISREDALARYNKIVNFLENADRFHGAWPHWLDGKTGRVKPFSKYDDGGDLVETAFLVQGMITVAEYFKNGNDEERALSAKLQNLWYGVDWKFYTNNENTLYWHWSPNHQWKIDFDVVGYNECLIMYVLAAASPTYGISKEVYDIGWARNGAITSDVTSYDLPVILDHYPDSDISVGPLFWAHYSYLGLNPMGLNDAYADYEKLNKNHALIHYRYALDNPNRFEGYGKNLWGFTSSYSLKGYAAHSPEVDLGVISPTAALSSIPYTPKESIDFLRNLYKNHDSLIGPFGPYDAFSLENNWYVPRYLAIDQGPIPVMVENYRTGLLWELFMKNEDVQRGLKKLAFNNKSS